MTQFKIKLGKGVHKSSFFLVAFFLFLNALSQERPTYNNDDFRDWVAHPQIADPSDIDSNLKAVDVFFVYPTLFMEKPVTTYSADIRDNGLNKEIKETTIFHQASAFSKYANVYAPYYRQMHIQGYYVKNDSLARIARKAFDTAYADVKRAFYHYIEFENENKPFILASHSQGTNHAERLLKEEILPNTSLKKLMVNAYLVGMPLKDDFNDFPPCISPTQTGCFISWRTYGNDFLPEVKGDSIVCINPISFDQNRPSTSKKEHLGIRFINGKLKSKRSVCAEVVEGTVQIKIAKWPLKLVYNWDNYHIADYNIFWPNIQNDVGRRIEAYSIKSTKELLETVDSSSEE